MKKITLILLLIVVFAIEILRVYFIMPFPGSQQQASIDFAYWIDHNILWLRMGCWLIIAYLVLSIVKETSKKIQILLASCFLLYCIVCYFFNFRFLADKMFYQPKNKISVGIKENKIPLNKLVIGVHINGESRAYPIQLIGYHHQVKDTIGGESILVTYCTVCRTGRVYSSILNGKDEKFRLVGMDHFNAMFEDATTKSWWRQATREAAAGPLKGQQLREIPSYQMSLGAWLKQYPSSYILQPDSLFKEEYEELKNFDNGTIASKLEKRDSLSWQKKSWVIGIKNQLAAKAIDWNELVNKRLISDSLPNLPFVLLLDADSSSYYCYARTLAGNNLSFQVIKNDSTFLFRDIQTQSTWNILGKCINGKYEGSQLTTVPAYQEFWHSWKTFQPHTSR